MTMPHLGNCPHKPGTWCLTCVREEWERREAEADAMRAKLSAAKARIGRMRELAMRTHYSCEDSWYSCPKSTDGCANENEGTECNCGADEHNAEVERICNDLYPPQAEGD